MADIKKQDNTELVKAIAEKREQLRTIRFSAAGSRSRNTREGRTLRKEIARIMTELRAREIASNSK